MTASGTAQAPAAMREAGSTGSGRSPRSRPPVDRLLPRPLLEQLRRKTQAIDKITPELVTELHQRFDIEDQYGVSKRRLRNYLERCRSAGDGDGQAHAGSPGSDQDSGEPSPDQVEAVRRRQASVAEILEGMFGQLAKCSPSLWAHRAYLMLVGLVYERLASNEAEIPTDELIALAKILAENRRAEARLSEHGRPDKPTERSTPATDALPENFADIVRQVYGTNFQTAETAHDGEDRPVHNAC